VVDRTSATVGFVTAAALLTVSAMWFLLWRQQSRAHTVGQSH
jgi:hypothetical protein